MSLLQRMSLLGAMLTFLFGAWRGWSLPHSLERAFLAYVALFGVQVLFLMALVRLSQRRPRRG
ncbi:MAG: hypothetical protein JW819_01185 [Candidatus Krumholzibacteriota bacterium]|jgi:hypothetical protein|nr:hypothetical protein [Candidatus Krumholzibacteriota bacterium]